MVGLDPWTVLQPDDPDRRLLTEALVITLEAAERARQIAAEQAEQQQLEDLERMFPTLRTRG
jgi:hypothetical protein